MAGTTVIALFDVDGTLSSPRQKATVEMLAFMQQLRAVVPVGIVGGSDFSKIAEQLGGDILSSFDYVFAENGLVAYKGGQLLGKQSIKAFLGEQALQRFLNFVLRYVADLSIPVKRGTFVEFRDGMINVSPIGRNCSQEERDEFERYDAREGVRRRFVAELKREFADLDLCYSVGGQISFDVFPRGWDKTYCLRFLDDNFETIHFFGDKTAPGGNDHEIYTSERTVGHRVVSPDDTRAQCTQLFLGSITQ